VEDVAAEADALAKRMNEIDRKAKQNLEVVERLGDSVAISKNVLKKFPSQKKVLGELDTLQQEEQKVLDNVNSLGKVLEAAGGRQITAKKFEEITKRMEERSRQVRRDLDALESTLEHEKSTYLTYQKIRERIVPSMEAYRKKLTLMNARIAKIQDEAASEREALQKGAKELEKKMKGGQMEGIIKVAEEIREKKRMLEEIRDSLDRMVSMSENLNKRITLLSREAKLLQIRAGVPAGEKAPKGAGPPPEKRKEEIRHQLELSKDEEKEFRRKREELKKLIKTLWETES
jgi:DNA repair exonuclease SbcCD ATPase subunit